MLYYVQCCFQTKQQEEAMLCSSTYKCPCLRGCILPWDPPPPPHMVGVAQHKQWWVLPDISSEQWNRKKLGSSALQYYTSHFCISALGTLHTLKPHPFTTAHSTWRRRPSNGSPGKQPSYAPRQPSNHAIKIHL